MSKTILGTCSAQIVPTLRLRRPRVAIALAVAQASAQELDTLFSNSFLQSLQKGLQNWRVESFSWQYFQISQLGTFSISQTKAD